MSHGGTDFLVYGLSKEWFLSHPEIEGMRKKKQLALLAEHGALIIQAHPFREAGYIDCIRLFPRQVHGVETLNACRTDFENRMAEEYSKNYDLLPFAGTDNHLCAAMKRLGGMRSQTPITDEADFVSRVKNGQMTPFFKVLS